MSNNTQPLADEVRDAVRVQLTELLRIRASGADFDALISGLRPATSTLANPAARGG